MLFNLKYDILLEEVGHMQVKNIQMQGNIEMFIDFIEKELIKSNIRYVKVIGEGYYEIHFLEYIYRLYYSYESIKSSFDLLQELIDNINQLSYKDVIDSIKSPIIIGNKINFSKEKSNKIFFENKHIKQKVNTKGFKNDFRRR